MTSIGVVFLCSLGMNAVYLWPHAVSCANQFSGTDDKIVVKPCMSGGNTGAMAFYEYKG